MRPAIHPKALGIMSLPKKYFYHDDAMLSIPRKYPFTGKVSAKTTIVSYQNFLLNLLAMNKVWNLSSLLEIFMHRGTGKILPFFTLPLARPSSPQPFDLAFLLELRHGNKFIALGTGP
jgi:hypothetical protein